MKQSVAVAAVLACALASGAVAQDGSVARSMFTTAVEEREPVDSIDKAPAGTSTVYYYTDLRDFADQTITHRWSYRGEVMAEVPFNVGGPRWRVWSSKNLQPTWTGQWTVTVLDGEGNELTTNALIVGEDAEAAPAVETTAHSQAVVTEAPADGKPQAEAQAPAAEPSTAETAATEPTGEASQ